MKSVRPPSSQLPEQAYWDPLDGGRSRRTIHQARPMVKVCSSPHCDCERHTVDSLHREAVVGVDWRRMSGSLDGTKRGGAGIATHQDRFSRHLATHSSALPAQSSSDPRWESARQSEAAKSQHHDVYDNDTSRWDSGVTCYMKHRNGRKNRLRTSKEKRVTACANTADEDSFGVEMPG